MIAILENTCDNPESVIDFMYHNFGDRGSSSVESAAIGGMAHSLIFLGTDNFNSTLIAEKYYNAEMSGYSVNASEHSSTTSWGKDNEFSMVRNHINISRKIKSPVVAAVGDSYDILHFTDVMTSGKYKTAIESETYPTLTIRPDSGNPFKVIPDMLKIMETNKVRYKINSKTLKVFYKYRILWGDGITPDVIMEILKMVIDMGYSPENFLFGSGGDLMQKIDRDTCGIAYKCSNIYYRDENSQVHQREVFKDPVTDKRKRSKKGELELVERNGKLITVKRKEVKSNDKLLLKTVYRNGKITREYDWNTVKSNINK
jgi:nicotinamide phosphoribosyltransferase